uniref:Uncharacterized protein n=1 Tax=Fusarium oxysporum (strain Fo5176) TaxID=660025 RepID=A0A0D2X9N4_FUSOF
MATLNISLFPASPLIPTADLSTFLHDRQCPTAISQRARALTRHVFPDYLDLRSSDHSSSRQPPRSVLKTLDWTIISSNNSSWLPRHSLRSGDFSRNSPTRTARAILLYPVSSCMVAKEPRAAKVRSSLPWTTHRPR